MGEVSVERSSSLLKPEQLVRKKLSVLTHLINTPSPCLSTRQRIKHSSGKILHFSVAKENIPTTHLHPYMKCVTFFQCLSSTTIYLSLKNQCYV